MAFDPDKYLDESPSSFDPDKYLEKPAKKSLLEKAIEPITSYPETYLQMNREAQEQVGRGIEQLSKHESPWEVAKGVGNVGLGTMGYVASPIAAGLRTVVGKPLEENVGIPKEYSEFAAGMLIPGYGMTRVPKGPTLKPPNVARVSNVEVPLSAGQATGELPLIQREQAALRHQAGTPAFERAKAFEAEQARKIDEAHEAVSQGLDPYGGTVATTPYEAAEIASKSFQGEAAAQKAAVDAAYKHARGLPGEIHAGAFEGIGQKIKGDLTLTREPVVVSDELTPAASKMIKYLDEQVQGLKIQNRADPYGPPGTVTGVTLNGVDQWRKILSSFRNQAFGNATNLADQRATRAVLDAFDKQVDAAINGGLFSGDSRAVNAWNDARAAHSDYRSTFGRQGAGDAVGRVVQKVLGDRVNDPAGPNAVADFLYGSAGVNPTDLNRATALRFRQVLGAASPEWAAVRQGLWSRMTEKAPGTDVATWGPKATADRINKFLGADGKEMANAVFSPSERATMQSYADMMRKLEVPQAGANWSNNARKITEAVGGRIAAAIGTGVGYAIGHGAGIPYGEAVGMTVGAGAGKVAQFVADKREAAAIAKQMPILSQQMQAWGKAVAQTQVKPSPLSQQLATRAAITVDTTLKKLGMSMDEITHGTVPAAAEPEQNKRYGGRANQPDQNAQDKPHRAFGGRVNHFDPKTIGARKNPRDGNYYLPGKKPGTWFRVVPHNG